MTRLAFCVLSLAAVPLVAETDPALLQMAPDSASAIAGLQLDQGKQSPFGRYVLSHFGTPGASAQQLMTQAGFDPRRDLREVLIVATSSSLTASHRGGLVLARGAFDPARISTLVQARGGTTTPFQGVDLLTGGNAAHPWAVAFPDNTTAVMGSIDDVKAAIVRRAAATPASTELTDKAKQLSSANDFWFLTLAPVADLLSSLPSAGAGTTNQNTQLLQAVTQASGGVRFGDNVVLTADAVTRSDKDAQSLEDVLRFLAGMVQSNRTSNATAGQIAGFLDALVLTTSANVMHLSLSVPEPQLEAFLNAARIAHPGPHSQPHAMQHAN